MPTTRFYPKVAHLSLSDALPAIVKFLINDPTAAYTGPNWEIIQGYDGTQLAGSKRSAPTDPHDVSTFTVANFSWSGAHALSVGDWIVLRSATGVCGNKFEIYIELHSTSVAQYLMIPYDNFDIAAAEASPPAFPATGFGSALGSAGLVSMTGYTTNAYYTCVADEGMATLLFDDGATPAFIYFGEVEPARLGGTPADDRPFVINDTTTVSLNWADTVWNRIDPLDDATLLTSGASVHLACNIGAGNVLMYGSGRDTNYLGLWGVFPVGLYFNDTSHRHFVGYFRNIGSVSQDLAVSGTLNSMAWMYRRVTTAIAFAWDGVTAY
jgi:hypothetical protein